MSIGLKRGTVRLEPHAPAWVELYAKEERQIRNTIGALIEDVQHVGSTAVADLHAKPIIDIAIAVADLTVVQECVDPLVRLGYEYFGDRDNIGDHFFAKGPDDNRTHYIHMVRADSENWKHYLIFRDVLRQDSEMRQQYDALKRKLAQSHAGDRKSYTELKGIFVENVLKARTEQGAGGDAVNRA